MMSAQPPQNLSPSKAPQPSPDIEEIWQWRTQLVRRILQVVSVIGIFALAAGFFALEARPLFLLYASLYIGLLAITFGPNVSPRIQTYAVLALVYGLGILALYEDGLSGDGRVALLALPVLAAAFLGIRQGVYALGLAIFTLGTFTVLYALQVLGVTSEVSASANPLNWVSGMAVFTLLAVMVLFTQSVLLPRFAETATQLHETRAALAQKSSELAKNQDDLQRQMMIAEMNTGILNDAQNTPALKDFLDQAVRRISIQYGIYHVGVFLPTESGERVELWAASSATGRNLISTGFSLSVNQSGVLAETLRSGRPQVIAETKKDTGELAGPQLIETHSEMIIPLRSQNAILGALDLQNREAFSFGEADLATLQTTANLLALGITSFQGMAVSGMQKTARAAQPAASAEDWRQFVGAQANWGYRYDSTGITPLGRRPLPAPQESAASPAITIPITMRDKVVGVIQAHKPAGLGLWNQTETILMRTLADQLSVALESARLFEETQRRAAQERLVGEVTSQMRQSLDVDMVLRTAVSQIRQALSLESAEVRLEVNQPSQPLQPGENS